MKEFLLGLLLSLPALLLALSVHECAHGYVAYKMGDYTAKYSGRLSLNPLRHLDPVGAFCLLVFHFGWAKPVPINPNNFKNRRKGVILVSLAGPASNFVMAILSALVLGIVGKLLGIESVFGLFNVSGYFMTAGLSQVTGLYVLLPMLYYCVILNIGLMAFNLIPIPPLDGSRVLLELLPYRARNVFYSVERYSFLILILLLGTGVLSPVMSFMSQWVFTVIEWILNPIF